MRSTLMTWILLMTLGIGSASISWVRIDGQGNGWMGIQLASGEEVRVEFADRDASGDLSAADLRGERQRPRRSLQRRAGQQVLSDVRSPLQQLGN